MEKPALTERQIDTDAQTDVGVQLASDADHVTFYNDNDNNILSEEHACMTCGRGGIKLN
jgi:hypothetical protein